MMYRNKEGMKCVFDRLGGFKITFISKMKGRFDVFGHQTLISMKLPLIVIKFALLH